MDVFQRYNWNGLLGRIIRMLVRLCKVRIMQRKDDFKVFALCLWITAVHLLGWGKLGVGATHHVRSRMTIRDIQVEKPSRKLYS